MSDGTANGPTMPNYQFIDGWNGGANNGTYSFISSSGWAVMGGSAPWGGWSEIGAGMAFTTNSKYVYHAQDMSAFFISSAVMFGRNGDLMDTRNGIANSSALYSTTRGAPDDTQPLGWKYPMSGGAWTGEEGPSVGDVALFPNGTIGFTYLNVEEFDLYKGKVGFAGGPAGNVSSCIGIITDPENPDFMTIRAQIDGNGAMTTGMVPYNINGRRMGTKFPTYLWTTCNCDPLNIQAIMTTATYPLGCIDTNCTSVPVTDDGFKITECVCSGGATGANPCDIADPMNQPPYMVANGKTWSATCQGPNLTGRWEDIVNAVQNLAGGPQTVTFTYSFIQPGRAGVGGGDISLAMESGPGTANPNGNEPWCASYPKTYPIFFADWQTEIAGVFAEVKALIEGRFNTLCGYPNDLTINFVDMGYEVGGLATAVPLNTIGIVSSQPNGTYTDANAQSNIGDFRIGYMPNAADGCGVNQGARSGTLAWAYSPSSLAVASNGGAGSRPNGWQATLFFDSNEDWRKVGDPIVANSFSIKYVGAHEILHAMGLGHDIAWDPFPCNDSDDCCAGDGNCGCPCYQQQNYPACMGLPCGVANPNALMGPWATSADFSTNFPTGLAGPEGIYEQRAICGIYSTPSANYGCMDEVCLGCTYLTYYSTDFANLTQVSPNGIITWDDGTPAGERCFEVEYMPNLPNGYVDTTPVVPVTANQGGTCVDCLDPANQCWELNLCPCNSIPGAPQTIITTTDMTAFCSGTQGNGAVIEIDLWPGACYEINCTPQPCPQLGAVAVVITNTYIDCSACCSNNQLCYDLCPCNPVVQSNTCASFIDINPAGCFANNSYEPWEWVSDPVNGLNNIATGGQGYKFKNSFLAPQADPCMGTGANSGCHFRQFEVFQMFHVGPVNPAGYNNPYNKADDFIGDLLADGMPGVVVGTTIINQALETAINVYFASLGRDPIYFNFNIGPCTCITTSTCITVTNDLSGLIGTIVDLQGPVTVPGLNDVDCYIPTVCGPCTTGQNDPCTPLGAVTIDQTYATCVDCDSGNPLDCYKLIDCSDPNNIIDNICADATMDAAFLAGQIIQINGNVTCWEIHPSLNCDPLTCITVVITASFASCAACTGTQMWECVGPCDCQPSAGAGWPSEAQCLANLNPVTGLDCCPSTSYDCDANCNCIPVSGATGAYPDLPTCQTAVNNPVTGLPNCCINVVPSWDCGQFTPGSITVTCQDPGNGTGQFASLLDCNNAIASQTAPCDTPSWDCVVDAMGNSTCVDPGTGLGTWNASNGGLAACAGCNGCPLSPLCTGVDPTYDCDPTIGCFQVLTGLGAYADLPTCDQNCDSFDPGDGIFEGDCENCLTDPNMQLLMERVAEMCGDCNPPFGLEQNEVICDDCFGQSNLYVIFDSTSTFYQPQTTTFQKLSDMLQFKTDVVVPAFNQLKADFPTYKGNLYILPGRFEAQCNDVNDSGVAVPANPGSLENWLEWAAYPLVGNKGANGPGATPFVGGTLPVNRRASFGHTMVQGVGGAPQTCGAAYTPSLSPIVEQILILPGSYPNDGFTQLNPWQDGAGKEGMSDPYHEFEGGDRNAIVMIFCDESQSTYYGGNWSGTTANVFQNPQGTCGAPLANGLAATSWQSYGNTGGTPETVSSDWKLNYNVFMDAYRFGIDANGVINAGAAQLPESTQKVMMYIGSTRNPANPPNDVFRNMFYHIYQAIGGEPGTVSSQGHVACGDYIPIPAAWGMQAYAVTDPTIPNAYMGASGGGDPTHITGYKGGSLSEYGFRFFIPDYPIDQMNKDVLYDLWKEYLSDCV